LNSSRSPRPQAMGLILTCWIPASMRLSWSALPTRSRVCKKTISLRGRLLPRPSRIQRHANGSCLDPVRTSPVLPMQEGRDFFVPSP